MQIKIAFGAIFLVDRGISRGRNRESITAERKENGGKLAGKSASTKQPMAMANINKQHFLLAGSCAVVLSVFSRWNKGRYKRSKGEGKS